MPDENPSPRGLLEALATVSVDHDELKVAALTLIGAGRRFLTALGTGSVIEVELGKEPPIRVLIKQKPTLEEE